MMKTLKAACVPAADTRRRWTLDAGHYRGIYYRYPSCHTEAYRSPTMCNIPASRVSLSLLNCFVLIKMDEAEAAGRVGNLGRFPRPHFLSLLPSLHSLTKASVWIGLDTPSHRGIIWRLCDASVTSAEVYLTTLAVLIF